MDGDRPQDAALQTDSTEARRWTWATAILIGGLLVFRVVYGAFAPFDLISDESYYWDWSRQLDWGYYSKPPMIAWLIGLSTRLLGSHDLAVRFPAILMGTLGLAVIYLLASRMYDARTGFVATLLAAATPGAAALSLMMTIDAPLLLFWSLGLYAIWRILERPADRRLWLVLAAIVLGLGLLTKQTTLAFFALTGMFLLISPEDRVELKRPGMYLCAAAALLFLTPVVLWNMRNEWITVQHTREHFVAQPLGFTGRAVECLEFVASQFLIASPVTCGVFAGVCLLSIPCLGRLSRRERFLLCFSAAPLAGVLVLSSMQHVEPNWPAPFCLPGVVLAAAALQGKLSIPFYNRPRPVLQRWAIAVGVLCVVATYAAPYAADAFGWVGGRLDPVARLRGWKRLALAVEEQRAHLPGREQALIIDTSGRDTTSALAFYLPDQPRVYHWSRSPLILSQYDLWGGPTAGDDGRDALIVTGPDSHVPADLARRFERIQPFGQVSVDVGNGRCHRRQLWRGERFSTPSAELAHRTRPRR